VKSFVRRFELPAFVVYLFVIFVYGLLALFFDSENRFALRHLHSAAHFLPRDFNFFFLFTSSPYTVSGLTFVAQRSHSAATSISGVPRLEPDQNFFDEPPNFAFSTPYRDSDICARPRSYLTLPLYARLFPIAVFPLPAVPCFFPFPQAPLFSGDDVFPREVPNSS